jgi:DNA-3-methyladenine glycosylase II
VNIDWVMTDHPSWLVADDDSAYRAVRNRDAVWALTVTRVGGRSTACARRVSGNAGEPPLDIVDPACLTGPKTMVSGLRQLGTVARWRNPDLWDALATSIVRQVIRAGRRRVGASGWGPAVRMDAANTCLGSSPCQYDRSRRAMN